MACVSAGAGLSGEAGAYHFAFCTRRRLNTDIVAVLKLPEIRERLANEGIEARSTTSDEFAQLLVSDLKRWASVIERAGVRIE